jgi:ABC-type phosphate/phosphonate transport system permease subunit
MIVRELHRFGYNRLVLALLALTTQVLKLLIIISSYNIESPIKELIVFTVVREE